MFLPFFVTRALQWNNKNKIRSLNVFAEMSPSTFDSIDFILPSTVSKRFVRIFRHHEIRCKSCSNGSRCCVAFYSFVWWFVRLFARYILYLYRYLSLFWWKSADSIIVYICIYMYICSCTPYNVSKTRSGCVKRRSHLKAKIKSKIRMDSQFFLLSWREVECMLAYWFVPSHCVCVC